MKILQNALYFPEHDYYMVSRHVHDYQTFEYLPGHHGMVDGGSEYLRGSVTPPEHEHLVIPFHLSTESAPEEVRDKLLWGSLPLDKTKPQVHTYRPIKTLSVDHLRAILDNCANAGPLYREVVEYWWRQKKGA